MVSAPRVVVAAAASSAGKTTIATGLLAALAARGVGVQGFKVGPDFIDPGYHALATGRPGRNLDAVLVGADRVAPLFLHGMTAPEPAQIGVVEGVMGLFDGQLGRDGHGSTAHITRLLDAPVVVVIDAAGSSRTAAVAALGLRAFDPRVRIAGAIVNRVGSDRHAREMTGVLEAAGLPVLGIVPRSADIAVPSRHLGLVPAAERDASRAVLARLAEHIAEHVDLDAVLAVATAAPALDAAPWRPHDVVAAVPGRPLVGLMGGRAFTFRYAEVAELLDAAGCRVVEIDPLRDTGLPADLAGLYIGGGFPEVHAAELSANAALRGCVADAVRAGMPTVAECAGQLYLARGLDGHPLAGALDAEARMTPRLTLGYREALAIADTLVARAGERVVGHEFHRTQTSPAAAASPAWEFAGAPQGFSLDPAATGTPTLHASYLHVHWAGVPQAAQRFADAASACAASGHRCARDPDGDADRAAGASIDLHHHGDADVAPGQLDLAVNVMRPAPPPWLADVIAATITGLGAYPDAHSARAALARRHGVDPAMVLPTAGAAEAFVLIARTLEARSPLVVHPQFTEPEAALRSAGLAVQRWLLPVDADPAAGVPSLRELPDWADALFVGNPTNPTGWLHSRAALRDAARGRLLVVDEAFMDAAGEAQTLIGPDMPDRLVVRSLSKTWGLAGLRVGYVVGDPAWIARLQRAQPAWPVSAGALAAMVATASNQAVAQASELYTDLGDRRDRLTAALRGAGFPVVTSAAPFVLIDTRSAGESSVVTELAARGIAVRRGETIPGLAPHWIRARVGSDAEGVRLVEALDAVRAARRGSHTARKRQA